eukprot:TRINITY_DN25928_c0_g1_i1.p1 TRINITY_DN25928_c0_g1~~TRINITY_DN25928_c0_g1_i1.p1  ORF type:complete len:736 (-),score=161.39 TRINITY_DN25928_c0_g1_i1:83-2290(-)
MAEAAETKQSAYFVSPADEKHQQILRETFPSCSHIDCPEQRSVTFEQLQTVLSFALANCHTWQDLERPRGHLLSSETLNSYHLIDWVIKPAATPWSCSLAELLAEEPQDPSTFVICAWRQQLQEVRDCLSQQPEPFWMAACALRESDIEAEKSVELRERSCCKAMKIARSVVLTLDEEASALKRTWCLWEVSLGAFELRKPLELAACTTAGASVLTSGLTAYEEKLENKTQGLGYRMKAQRERNFPVDRLASALSLAVQTSGCTDEHERRHLLNTMAGKKDLEEAPKMHASSYGKVNDKLRSLFAQIAWYQTVESPSIINRHQLADVLAADVRTDSLVMDFSGCQKMDDANLEVLATGIPRQLVKLELRFWMCAQLESKGLEALAKSLPAGLKTLVLDFRYCGVGQAGFDAVASSLPAGLTYLSLSFGYVSGIKSLGSLERGLGRLESLRSLTLDFSGLDGLGDGDVGCIADVLKCGKLRNLFLNFKACRFLCDAAVETLAPKLPKTLTQLELDFAENDITAAGVDALGASLPLLTELVVLHASFQDCPGINEASAARFAQRLPSHLQGAKLNVMGTMVPFNIQKICRRLQTMRAWMPQPGRIRRLGSKDKAIAGQQGNNQKEKKAGLQLRSVEMLLHRGLVQPLVVQVTPGSPAGSPKVKPSQKPPSGSPGSLDRHGRSYSEPWIRPMNPVLPKIAKPLKDPSMTSLISGSHPESMFSRPRTIYRGCSEPLWTL